MTEKREKIKSIRPDRLEKKKQEIELLNISKAQANEELRMNETISKNKQLKKEIDTLRKEIMGAKREISKLTKNIASSKKEAKTLNKEYCEGKKCTEETNN